MPTDAVVVHLVHARNGAAPLRSFLEAYRGTTAGAPHELVLALKGYDDADETALRRAWEGFAVRTVAVPDRGFDLGSYRWVAERLDQPRICFLNSFARPVADGWLGHLLSALAGGAGVAGATGSWESHARNASRLSRRRYALRGRGATPSAMFDFPPFPNPHLRTNAFAMERDLFLRLDFPDVRDKLDAYRLESGAQSISRQVTERGFPAVVVGRGGATFVAEQWPDSACFRSRDQENLLVADNATDAYAAAGIVGRRRLRRAAWGRP